MARAGIGPQPMLAFIDSAGTFNLNADEIVYLHDLGVSGGLITAMIQHDNDLSSGVLPLPATAVPKLPPSIKTIAVAATNASPAAAVAKVATPPPPAATAMAAKPVATLAASEPPDDEDWYPEYSAVQDSPSQPGFAPVRKPYPVQLTDPIIVVRAPGRVANVVSIQMLP